MRRVEMINNGSVTKGLAELNHHIRYEQKETRNGVTDEGQMLSEEDESRINEDNNVNIEPLQRSQVLIHRLQQQPQAPIVRWEKFLHVRSLKVLLVENDDSTRHVVSALLRNCSYEVTAVEDGLQAWKVLDDSTNRIDLVLTEVVMPFMSGLGLLGKIMSHRTRKNIPVIMMSSHDSMGIVFKCLSKGAVDFLVKPIRKNELKNLWQHVWRKCHSSSGSGSESGIRTQKPAKMISADESDKSGSNDDKDDDQSISLNARDGSDQGSGTQSSWTKRAVEVDSLQTMLEGDQLADDPPDSTCAQVNYSCSRPEVLSYNRVSMTATRKRQREDDELGNAAMGKHLTIGVPENSNLQLEGSNRMTVNNTEDTHAHKLYEMCSKKDDEMYKKGPAEHNIDTPNGNLSNKPAVLMDFISNRSDFRIESSEFHVPNDLSNIAGYITEEHPSLELSLKSFRDVEDNDTNLNEQNIWKPSSISAFSRYNSASTANPAPMGNICSSSLLDNSSEATPNLVSKTDGSPPNQHSNGSSNNNDMGSTTNNAFTKPVAFNDGYATKGTANIGNPSSAFQAVQNGQISPNQQNVLTKADSLTPSTVTGQAKETHQRVQVHHSHHHHHHHHHHVHKLAQDEKQPGHDDLSLNKMTAASPQCGSSNVWRVPSNGNGSNHSMNGSGSRSNHGSNGQNGSSIPKYNGTVPMEGDTDIPTNGGAGGASGSGSGSGSRSGIDETHAARREAALNKFRQKRKERCFEKKVRYHSRKKLAEQRPRIRGQFVRQVAQENKCKEADS